MDCLKMLMMVITFFIIKTKTADVPDICHVSSHNKNVLWAKGCDYPAVAFEKTTSVNYAQCITNCLNSIACTHFGFDGASNQCWLKNMPLGSKSLISSTTVCGFIRYRATTENYKQCNSDRMMIISPSDEVSTDHDLAITRNYHHYYYYFPFLWLWFIIPTLFRKLLSIIGNNMLTKWLLERYVILFCFFYSIIGIHSLRETDCMPCFKKLNLNFPFLSYIWSV